MKIYEDLLTSLKRASEMSIAIMKPKDNAKINHGLKIFLFMVYKRVRLEQVNFRSF